MAWSQPDMRTPHAWDAGAGRPDWQLLAGRTSTSTTARRAALRPRPRRRVSGLAALLLSMLVPAVLAGGLAALVLHRSAPSVAQRLTGAEVKRLVYAAPALTQVDVTPSSVPALRPVVATPKAGRAAPPARITIPTADVDAPVRAVGLRGGALEVPGTAEAGWFADGPRPGEPGRTVLIGHLDSHRGPAVFAEVPSLPRAALVEITDATGRIHRYRVVGGTEVEKRKFEADTVFGASPEPLLVLITCGGPFRPGRGYRDNVIVYARAA